ncbi:MAG TPA: T9SS type A sorting domain-containing protein [Saprospiraceae bacterium]|nr:T9SS type A sorting domain-containing protein [Saprospiraceae bacterium]HMQ85537.1 T9SS type A sorting domain-containing protein [Saprospiraceae bacterium]
MKQRLPIILFLLVGMMEPFMAQITITNELFPHAGDTLFTAVDNLPSGIDPGVPGGGQVWNFTTLQAPFTRQSILFNPADGPGGSTYPSATFYATIEGNTIGYFRTTKNSVSLLGFYGFDPLDLGIEVVSPLEPALIQQRAPMTYQGTYQAESNLSLPFATDDLPSGVLDGLPFTPDSLRMRIHLERSDATDAWGTMTIPGGIYDVLREKRIETREIRVDAKIGPFPWVDITDVIAQLLNMEDLFNQTETSYYFFSDESTEPIAVVTMDIDNPNAVARVEFKANQTATQVQRIERLEAGVYAYPNPAIVNVRFEFTNLPSGKYKLKILNILGIEVWSKTYQISGNQTEKIDISSLKKGTYLYSLVDDRGKTIVTRRLVVVRP